MFVHPAPQIPHSLILFIANFKLSYFLITFYIFDNLYMQFIKTWDDAFIKTFI